MRRVLLGLGLLAIAAFPTSYTRAASQVGTVPPSKTDICKSMGKLGGDLDYGKGLKYYWDCGSIDRVHPGVPFTENASCSHLDPRHRYGYWVSSKSVKAKLLDWIPQDNEIQLEFDNTSSKPAKARLWFSCMYA